MPRDRRDDLTLDLLKWEPEALDITYDDPRAVWAPSIGSRFARAISKAMKDCGKSREDIAKEMSAYLGEDITENMLNSYASEARETHIINIHRFAALIHATGDHKLLTLLTDEFGFAVVDRKYMPLCERVVRRAQLKKKRSEISKLIEADDQEIDEVEL